MCHVTLTSLPGFCVLQVTYCALGTGKKHFKNACTCQVEMSRLRAVCCLSVLTNAVRGLLSSFHAFLSLSAELMRMGRRASWRANKFVPWCISMPGEVLRSELLSELIVAQAGVTGTEVSVVIRQSPDLGYGEFRRAEKGVHICLLHHLLCELKTIRLRE